MLLSLLSLHVIAPSMQPPKLEMLASRRGLLVRAAALLTGGPGVVDPACADWKILTEQSKGGIFPDDTELREGSRAPQLLQTVSCINVGEKQTVALAGFSGKYIVLWFFPEDTLGLETSNNVLEASDFEKAREEFAGLDAIVIGCSAGNVNELKALAAKSKLAWPLLSDPNRVLIAAYGAQNLVGPTFRQTFIIDPSGQVRFVERNVELGVGNFNLANHVQRVQRQLYQVRNTDGWSV